MGLSVGRMQAPFGGTALFTMVAKLDVPLVYAGFAWTHLGNMRYPNGDRVPVLIRIFANQAVYTFPFGFPFPGNFPHGYAVEPD